MKYVVLAIILAIPGAGRAQTYDRNIMVFNESGETILEFHASGITEKYIGPDYLVNTKLKPGFRIRLNINEKDFCRVDFTIVMRSGRTVREDDFNVCDEASYTVE